MYAKYLGGYKMDIINSNDPEKLLMINSYSMISIKEVFQYEENGESILRFKCIRNNNLIKKVRIRKMKICRQCCDCKDNTPILQYEGNYDKIINFNEDINNNCCGFDIKAKDVDINNLPTLKIDIELDVLNCFNVVTEISGQVILTAFNERKLLNQIEGKFVVKEDFTSINSLKMLEEYDLE